MTYYYLDGHQTVLCKDALVWAKKFERDDRIVAKTYLTNRVEVSTVFLGIDHNHFRDGPPLLFETMIFGGVHDQYQERCTTWEQAEEQHKRVVEIAAGK